ncbi:MAG TPA: hypothetical protein VG053_08655 [Solirubrobacteraceae bacterium]|nr:hypothetical protein [Solirubrobacteraceae bacterium]
MVIPAVIFVVCFFAGVWASTRWLPPLAEGAVGGIAFFGVCGLLGAALGLAGLHIYSIIRTVEDFGGGFPSDGKGDLLASGLAQLLFEAGSVFGLALVVYLLAPSSSPAKDRLRPAADPDPGASSV